MNFSSCHLCLLIYLLVFLYRFLGIQRVMNWYVNSGGRNDILKWNNCLVVHTNISTSSWAWIRKGNLKMLSATCVSMTFKVRTVVPGSFATMHIKRLCFCNPQHKLILKSCQCQDLKSTHFIPSALNLKLPKRMTKQSRRN